jgi:hypothetical protein
MSELSGRVLKELGDLAARDRKRRRAPVRMKKGREKARAGAGYELAEVEVDRIATMLRGDPANMEVYAPREQQRVPAGGSWAMITRKLPAIEGRADEHIRVGRIFYVEHLTHADGAGFLPDGKYKVMLHSPWGDVCLWPYEYSVFPVADVVSLWAAGEGTLAGAVGWFEPRPDLAEECEAMERGVHHPWPVRVAPQYQEVRS